VPSGTGKLIAIFAQAVKSVGLLAILKEGRVFGQGTLQKPKELYRD